MCVPSNLGVFGVLYKSWTLGLAACSAKYLYILIFLGALFTPRHYIYLANPSELGSTCILQILCTVRHVGGAAALLVRPPRCSGLS